jgi:hypothetical protein
MGLIKLIVSIVGLLILAVVGLGAYLYFTDYEAKGEVTAKGRDAGGDYVIIRPDLIPRDFKQTVDANAAQFVCPGYSVTYRLQSGHYRVFDQQERLIYDSAEGLTDLFSPTRCAVLGG